MHTQKIFFEVEIDVHSFDGDSRHLTIEKIMSSYKKNMEENIKKWTNGTYCNVKIECVGSNNPETLGK